MMIGSMLLSSSINAQQEKSKTYTLDSMQIKKLRIKLERCNICDSMVTAQDFVIMFKDSTIDAKDSVLAIADKMIDNLQSQVFTLLEMNYKTEKVPFFKWSGFWIGLNASYGFDSVITKSTVLAKLEWEITATAKVIINRVWEWMGQAVIPLKEKFKLKTGIGYLIF